MKSVAESVAADVKEVFMDVSQSGGSESVTTTRKRRTGGRRRTQKQEGGAAVEEGPSTAVIVSKDSEPAPVGVTEQKPIVQLLQGQQKGGAPAKLILAPAKKKLAKLMLVPKNKVTVPKKRVFTAKRVRVTIDNTAKTVKRRRQILQGVDAMSEDQLRNAAVEAHLTRREKVDKVPASLLRQMLKDYRTMKGMLL